MVGVRLTNKALSVGGIGLVAIIGLFAVIMSSLPHVRTLSDVMGHAVIAMLIMGIGLISLSFIFHQTNKFQCKVEAERAKQDLDEIESEIKSKLHTLMRRGKNEKESTFDLVLKEPGKKKIQVVKEIIALTGLGLKQAVDIVENTSKIVKQCLTKEEADNAKKQFEALEAVIEIYALTGRKEEGYNRVCSVIVGNI